MSDAQPNSSEVKEWTLAHEAGLCALYFLPTFFITLYFFIRHLAHFKIFPNAWTLVLGPFLLSWIPCAILLNRKPGPYKRRWIRQVLCFIGLGLETFLAIILFAMITHFLPL